MFNYLQGSLFFPVSRAMLPLSYGGGGGQNLDFSWSICLNIPSQILMSFVFNILYYLTICLAFQECALREVLFRRLRAQLK